MTRFKVSRYMLQSMEEKIKATLKTAQRESLKNETPKTLHELDALLKCSLPKDLAPYAFQVLALHHALKTKKTYLALDAGTGKTIVAALISRVLKAKVVYICPPFLMANTRAEFAKWAPDFEPYIIPDSLLDREETAFALLLEILSSHIGREKVLIIDEAHRFKERKAKRSKVLFKFILDLFKNDRVIFMSGTPTPNARARELWDFIEYGCHDDFNFMSYVKFAFKFCAPKKNDFGWKFDGFANKREFKERITKKFMLRIKKDEVLDLPEKTEGLFIVGEEIPPLIAEVESKLLGELSRESYRTEKIIEAIEGELKHNATYLRALGEYKFSLALPFIESLLESGEPLIIFAIHKAVIKGLTESLKKYRPLVIDGLVSKNKRSKIVKTFQESKEHNLLIGNIQAMGLGYTLTKARRVLFIEHSWVDGENSQASDRVHRIGQNKNVLAQFVVLKDSIEGERLRYILTKRHRAL